jgi:hypothetical protein
MATSSAFDARLSAAFAAQVAGIVTRVRDSFVDSCDGLALVRSASRCNAVSQLIVDELQTQVSRSPLNASLDVESVSIYSDYSGISCELSPGDANTNRGFRFTLSTSNDASCTALASLHLAPSLSAHIQPSEDIVEAETLIQLLEEYASHTLTNAAQPAGYPSFEWLSTNQGRFTSIRLWAVDDVVGVNHVGLDTVTTFTPARAIFFWIFTLVFIISWLCAVVLPGRTASTVARAVSSFLHETKDMTNSPPVPPAGGGERPSTGDSLGNTARSVRIADEVATATAENAMSDREEKQAQAAREEVGRIEELCGPFASLRSSVVILNNFTSYLPSAVLAAERESNVLSPLMLPFAPASADGSRVPYFTSEGFQHVGTPTDSLIRVASSAFVIARTSSAASPSTGPVADPFESTIGLGLGRIPSPLHEVLSQSSGGGQPTGPQNPLLPPIAISVGHGSDEGTISDDLVRRTRSDGSPTLGRQFSQVSPKSRKPTGFVQPTAIVVSPDFESTGVRRVLSVGSGSPLSASNNLLSPGGNQHLGDPRALTPANLRAQRRASALDIMAHAPIEETSFEPSTSVAPTNLRQKRCTVMYCRLHLPSLSEHRLPSGFMAGVVHQASQAFLGVATRVANAFDGVVVTISVTHVAFAWNAFRPYQFHESRAALCAVHVEHALREALDASHCRIASAAFSIGLVTSHALAGTCVADQTIYPVFAGENYVLAQRIAALAPVLRATTLIAESTYAIAKAHVVGLPRDVIGNDLSRILFFELRGEAPGSQLQDVHNLSGSNLSASAAQAATQSAAFSTAFSLLRQARYDQAQDELRRLIASAGEDCDPVYRRTLAIADFAAGNPGEMQLLREMAASSAVGGAGTGFYRRLPQWLIHEDRLDDLETVLPDEGSSTTNDEGMSEGVSSLDAPSTEPRMRRTSVGRTPDFSADPALRTAITRGMRSLSRDQLALPREDTMPSHDIAITFTGESITSNRRAGAEDAVLIDDRGEQWTRSERVLGRGTFGIVRVGLSPNGALSAMKYIPLTTITQGPLTPIASPSNASMSPSSSTNLNSNLESALAEVAILSKLRHPNIVGYVSCALQPKDLVVILEYCGGGTLQRLVNIFGALPLPIVQRYARDILGGLNFLHKHGVTHRDLSLNNVLLTIDGECKLSDFGGSVTRSTSAPMAMGNIIGTPAFMAPETCTGQISMMCDVWSFGIILCVMASGRVPYDPNLLRTPVDFLRRLATDPNFGPEIPPEVQARPTLLSLVTACLARQVMSRPWAESLLAHPFFM